MWSLTEEDKESIRRACRAIESKYDQSKNMGPWHNTPQVVKYHFYVGPNYNYTLNLTPLVDHSLQMVYGKFAPDSKLESVRVIVNHSYNNKPLYPAECKISFVLNEKVVPMSDINKRMVR